MFGRLFVIGYPSAVGGANTELWHTLKLWRRFGLDVAALPTWEADPFWQSRLEGIGCRTILCGPGELADVPGLAGGVVVAFCNTKFLAVAERLVRLNCRTIWVGCMNWLFPQERLHYRRFGPFTRHVFQSRFQREELVGQLRRFGFAQGQGRIIRGAIDADEFPFAPRPHAPGEAFVVGRISRADAEKFSPSLWNAYARIGRPLRARVLGWKRELEARLGRPPDWAECLPAGSQSAGDFLPTLHALVQAGAAAENWPRVGLEAMAAGVPLVVDAKGGWKEMVRHGQTGYLCRNENEQAECAAVGRRRGPSPQHRPPRASRLDHGVGRAARDLVAMAGIVRGAAMKIAAVCVTYLRPRRLGWMIHCFLRQDYPADACELVVLDDAGQYESQSGTNWRLASTPLRFRTLGEKRNAAAAMVGDDVNALAVWDDDDLYLPWALSAAAAALQKAPWSRPSLVLHPQDDGQLRQHATGGLFHGGWAYRRELFAPPADIRPWTTAKTRRWPGGSADSPPHRPIPAPWDSRRPTSIVGAARGICRAWAATAIAAWA